MRLAILAVGAVLVGCGLLDYPVDRDDPRFAECSGNEEVLAAFRLRASDYLDHFPRMGRSPELEADAEAFAAIHGPDYVPATFGGVQPPRAGADTRYVCIYVGMPPAGGANVYGPVDITGVRP